MKKSVTTKYNYYIIKNKENNSYYRTVYDCIIDYMWTKDLEFVSTFSEKKSLEIKDRLKEYYDIEILEVEIKRIIKII